MNNIKRWKFGISNCDCVHKKCGLTVEQTQENYGWVMWEHHKEEVARLKEEVERLRIAGGESEPRFVHLSDYRHIKAELTDCKAEADRLKAEANRLREAHSDALADFWNIHKGYFDLKAEVERLRSSSFTTAVPSDKYEEIIKAGDALADFLGPCSAVRKWNKAKDGR